MMQCSWSIWISLNVDDDAAFIILQNLHGVDHWRMILRCWIWLHKLFSVYIFVKLWFFSFQSLRILQICCLGFAWFSQHSSWKKLTLSSDLLLMPLRWYALHRFFDKLKFSLEQRGNLCRLCLFYCLSLSSWSVNTWNSWPVMVFKVLNSLSAIVQSLDAWILRKSISHFLEICRLPVDFLVHLEWCFPWNLDLLVYKKLVGDDSSALDKSRTLHEWDDLIDDFSWTLPMWEALPASPLLKHKHIPPNQNLHLNQHHSLVLMSKKADLLLQWRTSRLSVVWCQECLLTQRIGYNYI